MKSLRALVLIVLAVLLPVRGAFAGAMACANAGGSRAVAVAHEAMPHDHAASHGGHAAVMHHGESHHGENHDGAGTADGDHDGQPPTVHAAATCQFCASGCCMASLVASVPALGPAPLTAVASFPPLLVPAPAFESGGPERPPRPC